MAAASMKRAGKVSDMAARAMVTVPSSKRLAHDFENVAGEFGQFVEEEHAVVGQRDFARARDHAAADQSGVGDGVVRRTKGARAHQAAGLHRARRRRCESWWSPGLLQT